MGPKTRFVVGACIRCLADTEVSTEGLCARCDKVAGAIGSGARANQAPPSLPLADKWRAANTLLMQAQGAARRASQHAQSASGMGEEYERAKRHELLALVALGQAAQAMLPLWSAAECDARQREQDRADRAYRFEVPGAHLSVVPS